MIVLSVQDLKKSFGIYEVLKGITFTLQNGEHMGLTGVNGCGKSTLIRIIQGEIPSDDGLVHKSKDLKIGYLAQQNDIDLSMTVWDAMLLVFSNVIKLENKIKSIEKQMQNTTNEKESIELAGTYHRLTEDFEDKQGYAYKGEIKGVLTGLGISEDYYNMKVELLSGGERTRVSLAKLLLQKPDLLLMDEPTNHLDLEAIAWLEGFLNDYKGALLVISHDRYFLDHICNTMGEIQNGKILKYDGNYSVYQEKRAQNYEARMKAFSLQQKQIDRENAIIMRYKSFNREKSIKAAESRQKRLDKIEIVERPSDDKHINFSFYSEQRPGDEVLKVHNLAKYYGDKSIFKNVSFKLRAEDRVALIGANGIGKSTLMHIIVNEEEADEGYTMFGTNVDPGYYDQHHKTLNPNKTVLDDVWDSFPRLNQTQVRSALGNFLFSGDDVLVPIHKLSGGEKGRVALTKLILKHNNLLLLDEPTNHLDSDSREVLEDALKNYNGTIFAISHDRYFINSFATRIFVMGKTGIQEFLGNYDDYIEKIADNNIYEEVQEGPTKTQIHNNKRKARKVELEIKNMKIQLKQLEKDIEKSEEQIINLEKLMADPDTYKDTEKSIKCTEQYKIEQEKQVSLYEEMEDIEEKLNILDD